MQTAITGDQLFYSQLGLDSKNPDVIDSLFIKEGEKNIFQSFVIVIRRIIHFFQTGVWVDLHAVGQALNEHRFREGVEDSDLARIEKLFTDRLSDRFVENAYREAEEETFFEAVKNTCCFFLTFLQSPLTVGAILPSSKELADEMATMIGKMEGEGNPCILEAGPGTGTFSREIIKRIGSKGQLDLVEYDEKFVQALRKRFGHLKNVNIIHGDFTKYQTEKKYDYCISGLPLASFEKAMVQKVYDVFNSTIKKGGKLAYFEYIGIPRVKQFFNSSEKKREFSELLDIKERFCKEHRSEKRNIWLNIPPARIQTITI